MVRRSEATRRDDMVTAEYVKHGPRQQNGAVPTYESVGPDITEGTASGETGASNINTAGVGEPQTRTQKRRRGPSDRSVACSIFNSFSVSPSDTKTSVKVTEGKRDWGSENRGRVGANKSGGSFHSSFIPFTSPPQPMEYINVVKRRHKRENSTGKTIWQLLGVWDPQIKARRVSWRPGNSVAPPVS